MGGGSCCWGRGGRFSVVGIEFWRIIGQKMILAAISKRGLVYGVDGVFLISFLEISRFDLGRRNDWNCSGLPIKDSGGPNWVGLIGSTDRRN